MIIKSITFGLNQFLLEALATTYTNDDQVVDDNDDQVVDDNNDQVVDDNNDQVVDDNDVDQLEGRHFKPGLAAVTSTNTLQRNRVLTLLKKK